jgi:DNA-binding NarL/FixJ family response regulator
MTGREREQQITDRLREGCSNAEIAETLGIAKQTVTYHLHHLYRRHGGKRVHLVVALQRQIQRQTPAPFSHRSDSPYLRPLEWEIIRLVASGCKNRDIAEDLGLSKGVVANYLRRIYDKLGFSNRVELAMWYDVHRSFEAEEERFQYCMDVLCAVRLNPDATEDDVILAGPRLRRERHERTVIFSQPKNGICHIVRIARKSPRVR